MAGFIGNLHKGVKFRTFVNNDMLSLHAGNTTNDCTAHGHRRHQKRQFAL